VARFFQKTSVSLHVQYFDMEQSYLQQVGPNLSSGQADSDGTHCNARVTKYFWSLQKLHVLYLLAIGISKFSTKSPWN